MSQSPRIPHHLSRRFEPTDPAKPPSTAPRPQPAKGAPDATLGDRFHTSAPPAAIAASLAGDVPQDPDSPAAAGQTGGNASPAWAAPAEQALTRMLPDRRTHLGRGLGQLLGAMAQRQDAMTQETDVSSFGDDPDPVDDPAILDWLAMKAQEEPARVGPPVSLAASLAPSEIAQQIAAGIDPFAINAETGLSRPPYRVDAHQLVMLARLCAACGDQDGIDDIMGDGCTTAILCGDETEMTTLAEVIRTAVRAAPMQFGDRRPLPPLRPQIVSLSASSASTRESSQDAAIKAFGAQHPVIVLATDRTLLTGVLAHLPVMTLAPVDADIVLFILREAVTGTGQMSETAVRGALPGNGPLARLPADTLMLALRSSGPIQAARRIATLARAPAPQQAAPAGPDLAALPGLGSARLRLTRIVDDLRAFSTGDLPWSDVSNGVILEGPPGTGKTTIAAAFARSAGMSFVPLTCTDWFKAGRFEVMLQAMHASFDAAHASAPCLLFIDEIDSLRDRGGIQDRNSSWNSAVVNAVLPLLDGAAAHEGVFVVGATNHPEQLDPAILRAGRLGRRIHIAPPVERELPAVFRYHLAADMPQGDLASLARQGAGMTPADVKAAVQEARSLARAAKRAMTIDHLVAAIGTARPPIPTALRRRIAIHEAGHVVAAHVTGNARPLSAVLSGDTGHVEMLPLPHDGSTAVITATLVRHLTGRAAEAELLGEVSGGSGGGVASDLAQATRAALQEALSLGRGEDLIWHPSTDDPAVLFARHRGLKDRIARRLDGAYASARQIIRTNCAAVEAIAAHLFVDGYLEENDLQDLLLYCADQPPTARSGEDGLTFLR
ncbi:ATP-dependent Zn proteases [Loktanella salsilacus]|uniref:ATP-dependent Zn proteases n=2 Tax=Loktanella salsilacus TaxID=195913 RepID=A0A1I4IXG8_9RHOB|nr:ATP-dependent Zn proteases [Loktanella salsilacus]